MRFHEIELVESFSKSESGIMTYWQGDGVLLVNGTELRSGPVKGTATQYFAIFDSSGSGPVSDSDFAGGIDIVIDSSESVVGISYIETQKASRNKGIASKVVRELSSEASSDLKIYGIVPEAVDFWAKLGVVFKYEGWGEDNTISAEDAKEYDGYADGILSSGAIKLTGHKKTIKLTGHKKTINTESEVRQKVGNSLGIVLALSAALVQNAIVEPSNIDLPEVQAIIANAEKFNKDVRSELDKVVDPRVRIREETILMLARTLWGEARSEGRQGMTAVAHVIKNRAENPTNAKRGYRLYGKGIQGVISKNKAFSAWNKSDINRDKMLSLDASDSNLSGANLRAWKDALQIAADVVDGKSQDPTKGATHYHTNSVNPGWAKHGEIVANIGDHKFYIGVDG